MQNRGTWNIRRRRNITSQETGIRSCTAFKTSEIAKVRLHVSSLITSRRYVREFGQISTHLHLAPRWKRMVSVIFQPLYPRGNSLEWPANWGTGWLSEAIVTFVRLLVCHCIFWNVSLGNELTETLPQPTPLLSFSGGAWFVSQPIQYQSRDFIAFPQPLQRRKLYLNRLNAELNPICHLLSLLGAHHILHVSR
jgi:hypothetical protein